ncbi:Putative heme-binding peroxidase [Gossypium arboreum]|nr:Putative heme-binding peroxidase [Gossypium arboreum]
MTIYINLDKLLIAQVLVNGRNQRVEYEALPTICFSCGKYHHTNKLCTSMQSVFGSEKDQVNVTPTEMGKREEIVAYGSFGVGRKEKSMKF